MRRVALLLLFFLVGAGSAWAHEIQPAYLELRQTGDQTVEVLWKVPARRELESGVRLVLPEQWTRMSEPVRYQVPGAAVERFAASCPGGLEGGRITIEGPLAKLLDVLVRIVRSDGSVRVVRLTPADPVLVIETAPSPSKLAVTYLRLGIEHILLGVDHLLFVLGLLLLVEKRWMVVKTVTSFTIAHSITLAIASLGYASAPLPPLNAAIALSILFLGPEIMRFRRGETSLAIEHPWVVAFAFGLLHGFGFASGLTALGLPRAEIPWALLLFNVGVEIGQLLFVVLILLLERAFRTLEIRWPRWVEALPAYTVGTLGAFWTIQRTAILFGARL